MEDFMLTNSSCTPRGVRKCFGAAGKRSARGSILPHDPDSDDEAGSRAGGGAGSQRPDADAEAEAAGEEQLGDWDDAGPSGSGSAAAEQETEEEAVDGGDARRRVARLPVAPPFGGPSAWLCRYCELEASFAQRCHSSER